MEFEKLKRNKRGGTRCDWKTTHPKENRSALWEGTWAGWPLGIFCDPCREEWERMRKEHTDEVPFS